MFLLWKGEVEGRLEPFFYKAEFVELEKKVKTKSTLVLRDFVLSIASGATPATTESEKYYVDNGDEGIPFLRVQNLTSEGVLRISDCKYINHLTHQTMLKRSQVREGDLLIKITGVGRMAIASVAPQGFIGNINQHVVVIKTKDRRTSEILAAYLNTDIAEKLATRRSTGGTRPALDYPALLSLPIIFDERVLDIMQNKIAEKHAVTTQSQALLASIDTYLLDALGIQLPPTPSVNLAERVFLSRFNEIDGNRFDPFFHQEYYKKLENNIEAGHFKVKQLGDFLCYIQYGASISNKYVEKGIPFLRIKDLKRNEIFLDEVVYLDESARSEIGSGFVHEGDFLISRSGTIGLVAQVPKALDGFAFGSFMIKFRLSEEARAILDEDYLSYFLNCEVVEKILLRQKIGAIQGNITIPTIRSIPIPLPPLSIQQTIAAHIGKIRSEVTQLQGQADDAVRDAKLEIERILLLS